jgi:hypothetical protein
MSVLDNVALCVPARPFRVRPAALSLDRAEEARLRA